MSNRHNMRKTYSTDHTPAIFMLTMLYNYWVHQYSQDREVSKMYSVTSPNSLKKDSGKCMMNSEENLLVGLSIHTACFSASQEQQEGWFFRGRNRR